MSQSSNRFNSWSECRCLCLPLVPIGLLVALLLYGMTQSQLDARELRQMKSALRAEGVPLSNGELDQWYDQRTSKEHTNQWRDIFSALQGLQARFGVLATDRVESFDDLVRPAETWEAESIVAEYVSDAQPIIDEIERIVEDADPVWQPTYFQGFGTLLSELQETRSVIRLLEREFRFAVHHDDSARALRAIRLMFEVEKAFSWRIGLVSELISNSHRAAAYGSLRQTLEFDFWSESELEQIARWLREDVELDERWRNAWESEIAMGLESLESTESIREVVSAPVFPFGISASAKLEYLETLNRQRERTGVGSARRLRDINTLDPENQFNIAAVPFANHELLFGLSWPSFEAYATALARADAERRWTLTGVGIRKFRLAQQRWPHELSELASVGLSPEEWRAVDTQTFGYRVDELGHALLWSIKLDAWPVPVVEPDPPTEDDIGSLPLDTVLLRLEP